MRNEFNDNFDSREPGRSRGKNSRTSRKRDSVSAQRTSRESYTDEDYYLDDDYNNSSQKDYSGQTGDASGKELDFIQIENNQTQSRRANSARQRGKRSAEKSPKVRRIRRIIILVIAEIFTLAGIFAYAYVSQIMNSLQRPSNYDTDKIRNEALTPEQKKHMTGYWTIAVFGLDSRDGNVNKGTQSDVIMLCNINRDTGEVKLASIYRDTYLNVSTNGTYNKINSAYATGGPEQAVAALNRNLDLDIEDYVTFNWKAVADGINMLGGVDIEITKDEFRYINGFITETVESTGVPSQHLKAPGMNHLDGVQAVAYGRLRLMDTDFARTERQRLIIEKAFEKAKQADLGLLNRILLEVVPQLGTNLTFSDFTDLILELSDFRIGETQGFPQKMTTQIISGKGDCVIPQTLESNVIELHKFLFNETDYQPSDTVRNISAKIASDSSRGQSSGGGSHSSSRPTEEPKTTEPETRESETIEDPTKESQSESGGESSSSREEIGPGITKPSTEPSGTGESNSESGSSGARPSQSQPGETESSSHSTSGSTAAESTEEHGPGVPTTGSGGPGHTTGASESTTAQPTAPLGPGQPSTAATQAPTAEAPSQPATQAPSIPVVSSPPAA
ncbi:MAG TPA: LCP family protein [Candidatus Hungatella pullicola]|nr:LCP family protein [Candidatus Hungatella pullicola]